MLNSFSPEPLNAEPDCTLTSPKKVEPLSIDSTTKPSFGETDAVTEPLVISFDSNASSVNAVLGILNNCSPLPLKNEPLLIETPPSTSIEPVNCEPLSIDFTLKPSSLETDAVTLPCCILVDATTSSAKADKGISNKSLPLPLKNDAETEPPAVTSVPTVAFRDTKIEPLNSDLVPNIPVPKSSTLNPLLGSTDAVIEPDAINDEISASCVSAVLGILNNLAPLPLKSEPEVNLSSPVNVEPLTSDVTMNPSFGSTDAVTEPVVNIFASAAIAAFIACCVSSESAARGISNNFSPLPLNELPLATLSSPKNVEPVNEVTTNPSFGETDAVTEPLTINEDNKASSVSAERGMLNKSLPLPLNTEPLCSLTSPIKSEPLSTEVTTNPVSGETDAVTEPDVIWFVIRASSVNAERGISKSPWPLPLNTDADTPLSTNNEELNSALSVPSNLNPNSGLTDAVTEPLAMKDDNSASSVNALLGISNKSLPLPLNTEPLSNFTSPKKSEPLSIEVTLNWLSAVDAVIAPLAIKEASSESADCGISNKSLPLPLKNDAEIAFTSISFVTKTEPVTFASPLRPYEPEMDTEPVNSCKSVTSFPNRFEPEENTIDDEIISTSISLATILLSTNKSPVILTSPLTSISPSNDDDTFTKNPVFGAIDADAEPLLNNEVSGKLFNSEPSPANEPLKEPVNSSNWILVTKSLLPSASDATSAIEPDDRLPLIGTPKLGSASASSKNSYLSTETSLGLTTLTFPLNNWLIYPSI